MRPIPQLFSTLSLIALFMATGCVRQPTNESRNFDRLLQKNRIAYSLNGVEIPLTTQAHLMDYLKKKKVDYRKIEEQRLDLSNPKAPMLLVRGVVGGNSRVLTGFMLEKRGKYLVMNGETNTCESLGGGCTFVREADGRIRGCVKEMLTNTNQTASRCTHTRMLAGAEMLR